MAEQSVANITHPAGPALWTRGNLHQIIQMSQNTVLTPYLFGHTVRAVDPATVPAVMLPPGDREG